MKTKNSNTDTDIIEKGGKCYWYFWHMGNEGARGILENVLLFVLKGLSPIYYAGFLISRILRKKSKCSKYPVISVGNLTLGGAGKTPCVEFLIKKLLDKKRKVGLLTKGYAREDKGDKKIISSKTKEAFAAKDIGDEPYLFFKHFPSVPIFISQNRAKSLSDAEKKQECDVFIMDDGFQYPYLGKDLEILLINKRNPFGNGSLFPAGFLREPIGSVKRADLIILTHADEQADEDANTRKTFSMLFKKAPQIPVLESIHRPLYLKDYTKDKKYLPKEFSSKRFLSLCSLADPLSFEESLKKINLKPVKKVRFPDHYIYKSKDIEWLSFLAQKDNVEFILTTEKDWVRFPKGFKTLVPTLCLIMDFKINTGEDIIDNLIGKILKRYNT